MSKIYIADIRRLETVTLKKDGITKPGTVSNIYKEGALFYLNRFGRMISFEYGTALPDIDEAHDYVRANFEFFPNPVFHRSCLYVDYSNISSKEVSKEEIKDIKRSYAKTRKSHK